jgi:tol-pal system protein YbgF
MRRLALLLALLPLQAAAQADPATLADIRGQIATLGTEIGGLRAELATTGALSTGVAGNTPLERLNSIEAELQRLTSLTEELENRVNRVVTDGTNRLGDLEFRVCEIEEGCDLGALGQTAPLGGVDNAAAVPQPAEPVPSTGPELAIGEAAQVERAEGVLATGDFRGAADLLATFAETYPGSPLTARAELARGRALEGLGENADAARAFLASFSADASGTTAAPALLGLGRMLGVLGQVPDACVTLSEVEARFPAAPEVAEARAERAALLCQ